MRFLSASALACVVLAAALAPVACISSTPNPNAPGPVDAGLTAVDATNPNLPPGQDAASPPGDDGGSPNVPDAAAPADSGSVDTGTADEADADASPPTDASFDAPATPCGAYCAAIMTYCTGANAQYPSFESCLGACAPLPLGTASDTSGDTLGCRGHFAALAQSSPATACPSAGPTGGGDVSFDGGTGGACGDACEALCTITQAVCTGSNKEFADVPTCMSFCASMTPTQLPPFSTADTTTNDFGCHMNQALAAASGTGNVSAECGGVIGNSHVCALGMTTKLDNAPAAFDVNLSVTSAGGLLTIQGDDNPTPTHWTLKLVLTAANPPGGQVSCSGASPSSPSITYTHYTNGSADEVYETAGTGSCTILNISQPAKAGDQATGNFDGTLFLGGDAGGSSHTVSAGSYLVVL